MKLLVCMDVLLGALLLAIPNMTRREILFAVPVPPDFRHSPAARHAITRFRLVVAAVVLAGIGAFLLCPAPLMNTVLPVVTLGTVICALLAFYWQYRALTPFAVEVARRREVVMTTAPERLPRFAWFAAGPFIAIGAAALYLYLNWDRIPERFPVHWSLEGPDRWATRSVKGVYGTLLFAAELNVYLLIMALASWYGARRSRSRRVMLGGIIAINNVVGCLFALIAVQPVLDIPFWAMMLGIMGAIIAITIVMVNRMNEPGEGPDPTPKECWKVGVIYYNPNDAVLFVEKRQGVGYTFNFANPWAWALMAGLVLIMTSAVFIVG